MLRQFNLRSSGKDIPVPSRTNYMKKLISQTETFLKNIRWKTFWFERNGSNDDDEDNSGHHLDITFVNMTPNQLLLLVNWLEPACI